MKSQAKQCIDCGKMLIKDEIALNKKLIAPDIDEFQCLECMSTSFNCDVKDLRIKIDEFREQGCSLFI